MFHSESQPHPLDLQWKRSAGQWRMNYVGKKKKSAARGFPQCLFSQTLISCLLCAPKLGLASFENLVCCVGLMVLGKGWTSQTNTVAAMQEVRLSNCNPNQNISWLVLFYTQTSANVWHIRNISSEIQHTQSFSCILPSSCKKLSLELVLFLISFQKSHDKL